MTDSEQNVVGLDEQKFREVHDALKREGDALKSPLGMDASSKLEVGRV